MGKLGSGDIYPQTKASGQGLFSKLWANIWDAVLAAVLACLFGTNKVPLRKRGPVPEVLLSHLLRKIGLYRF